MVSAPAQAPQLSEVLLASFFLQVFARR